MEKLSDLRFTMDSCNHCGQCKWIMPAKMHGWDFAEICPIHQYHRFDAYSGQGLLNISKEVLTGRLKPGEGLEKALYSCTLCGACDVNCKNVRDIEVLETIHALRELCAREGTVPASLMKQLRCVEESHNIYGRPHAQRFDWLGADFKDSPDADTALFVGCSVYAHPEIALAAIKLLKAGGVKFRLLREEEWCCGASLWRSGFDEQSGNLIRRNIGSFKALGIKTLITACAECFGAFRGIYPRFGEMDIEVLHISQLVLRLLKEGKISIRTMERPMRVTYHDPCMLGRLSEPWEPWEGEIKPFGLHVPEKKWRRGHDGVYSEPRELMAAIPGLELVEMPRNRENALCCGFHAGETDPGMSDFTASQRMREAAAVGAEKIVSCCPFCMEALPGSLDLCVLLAGQLEEGGGV